MYIVTHPGQAHRDDFLSCCLLIAKYHSRIVDIYRREPTPDELNNPEVIVLDVGRQFNKRLRNYDHHQFPAKTKPFCTLSAIVRHELGMENEFNLHEWFRFTAMIDSKGPTYVANHYGWSEFPFATMSPIEKSLLGLFEKCEIVTSVSSLIDVMRVIGYTLLDDVNRFSENLSKCKQYCIPYQVDGIPGIIMTGPKELVSVLSHIRAKHYPDAIFTITTDERSGGLKLYRYDDDPRLDFSRLENEPGIKFAHSVGFIAVTEKFDLGNVERYIRKAIVSE